MSRTIPWRHACSDTVHWRQLQALQATVYVLQQSGPTAFLLKEGDSPKKLRVSIGDPSSCTCTAFVKEQEICVHILWVILKLFRIPPENPITWQGSLVEREIQQLVKSRQKHQSRPSSVPIQPTQPTQPSQTDEEPTVDPRPIVEGDVCPICQDDMKQTQNLCYCRYSCGHSVHSRCMKIWADHQLTQGTFIHCPMCRADFGSLKMIMTDHLKRTAFRPNIHAGTSCKCCNIAPIEGKIYTCTICDDYMMCMKCFASNAHSQHPFQFREKPTQRWRPAIRSTQAAVSTEAANQLQSRDLSTDDYDILLALDNPSEGQGGLSAKELAALKSVMLKQGNPLLKHDVDRYCQLCLCGYTISQHVTTLPCSHQFHQICAINFLQHQHDYCPTCREKVEVILPRRKKPSLVRYNLKEEEDVQEVKVEFSLSGAAVAGSRASPIAGLSGITSRKINSQNSNERNHSASPVKSLSREGNRQKSNLPLYTGITTGLSNFSIAGGERENFNAAFENNKTQSKSSLPKNKHRLVSRGLTKPDLEAGQDLSDVFVGKKEGNNVPVENVVKRVSTLHNRNRKKEQQNGTECMASTNIGGVSKRNGKVSGGGLVKGSNKEKTSLSATKSAVVAINGTRIGSS